MSCQRYEDVLVDLARAAVLEGSQVDECRAHVARCQACAARLDRERVLTAQLRELADASNGLQAPVAVEAALMRAFDAAQAGRSSVTAGRPARSAWWQAVAAAVLICSGAVAWRWVRTPYPPPHPLATATAPGSPASAPSSAVQERPAPAVAEAPATAALPVRRPGGTRPLRAGAGAASRAASRIVRPAGFVALPGAMGLPEFESGMIVRVEIALPSLPAYGVPIVPDALSSLVEADLLVGQDGRARAIRLVQSAAESRSRQ
jgi:hypothetical protein